MRSRIPAFRFAIRPNGPGGGLPARGFTLIEVLLAVVIFGIVLVAMHTVFYGALRLRNTSTEALQQSLPLQQTLTIIKRDLGNIVLPGGTFFGELQTAQSLSSSTNALSSLSAVQDAMPGQSSPAFYTTSGMLQDELPWGEVSRISYYLAPPTNNTPGKDLMRSVTRNLLPVIQEEIEDQWLMGGVERIDFYFYDGNQWRDYWDSTVELDKLPQGIKMELQLASQENDRTRRLPIELVIPVLLQASTNDTAQSTGEEL